MTKAKTKEHEPDLLELDVSDVKETQTFVVGKKTVVVGKKPTKAAPAKNAVAVRPTADQAVAPIPVNMLAVIARAAADPNCVPEKMRALLDMQKEIAAEESRVAFTVAFVEMQGELPTINAKGRIEIREKDRVSGERTGKVLQSTPYATFNEINRVTRPILQKHGFSLSFATDQSPDGRLIVRGVLKHIRGFQETTTLALPLETSGSKNNVQGVGSSLSYAKRYSSIALLNLVSEAPEDKDDDGIASGGSGFQVSYQGPAQLSLDQSEKMVDAIEDCGIGIKRFCKHYQITAVIDLSPEFYDEALAACADYKKKHPPLMRHNG